MNDKFPFDVDIEKVFTAQEFHASIFSIVVLALLIILLIKTTLSSANTDSTTYQPYRLPGTILSLERYDQEYCVTVEVYIDEITETKTFEISKDEFLKYKEGESVNIEITQHGWKILN